jgi:hypothetical protein
MDRRAFVVWALVAVVALHPFNPAAAPTASDGVPPSALWEAPGDLGSRDLFNGPWTAASAPDPRAIYTFVRPKHGGVNPGVVVRDPQGRIWHVKQADRSDRGAEGPVEVVLSRVLSAVGYHQPPVYFLPSFTMRDASGTHLASGGRFRLDEPSMRPRGSWSWDKNPFAGTRAYNGLLVILLIFNSWDLKDSNNTTYEVQRNDRVEAWYVVRDLGGALGESGRLSPKRNNIERFERQRFISGVADGFVKFSYGGKRPDLVTRRITVEDVEWATALLAGLDDRQWHDAFRAGGYSEDLSNRFIRKIEANILRGRQVTHGASGVDVERR